MLCVVVHMDCYNLYKWFFSKCQRGESEENCSARSLRLISELALTFSFTFSSYESAFVKWFTAIKLRASRSELLPSGWYLKSKTSVLNSDLYPLINRQLQKEKEI